MLIITNHYHFFRQLTTLFTNGSMVLMLTQKDLDEIEEIVEEKLEEKIKILPTKDEFFSKMDEVMGELATIRDEQTIISHQVSDHGDRLEKLEEAAPAMGA